MEAQVTFQNFFAEKNFPPSHVIENYLINIILAQSKLKHLKHVRYTKKGDGIIAKLSHSIYTYTAYLFPGCLQL